MTEASRFPGYQVLAKRDTPSWNEQTRKVIDGRLRTPAHSGFLGGAEWRSADALCKRIVPQPAQPEPASLVGLLDAMLKAGQGDGVREAGLPRLQDAWRLGLAALDAEARARSHNRADFSGLDEAEQDDLIRAMERGDLAGEHWGGMQAHVFFKKRVLVDVPALYYSLPKAWDEIGFGGPASPRGYLRLDGDRLDPWEAVEAKPGRELAAERANRDVG